MTEGRLVAQTGDVIVAPCLRTTNAFDRMRGLLFRPAPAAASGLLIDPCASVHTLAMAYAIDVVYLDADMRVVKQVDALKPWRMSACKAAKMTLELAAGQAQALGVRVDLKFQWHSA